MATPEQAGGIVEEQGEIVLANTLCEYRGEDGNRQSDSGISTLLDSSLVSPGKPPGQRYGWRLLSPWTTFKSAPEDHDGMFSRSTGKDGSKISSNITETSSSSMPPSTKSGSARVKVFSYNDLKLATRNFHNDSMLGNGVFGHVYKVWIDEHTLSACKPGTGIPVAVKTLNQEGFRRHRAWLAEIQYVGQLCHPNLVKLIGYCLEHEFWLLVYEFMPRGSLKDQLFRRRFHLESSLSWNLRMKVALGAAKGLAYLHSEEVGVIYRDFRTSHILIGTDYTAKLSHFGLAKDGLVGKTCHLYTTYGYEAPEYFSTGHFTAKSNIYSFGVVLLEMLSGRQAIDKNRPRGEHILVEWARPYLIHKVKISHVVDPRLEGQYPLDKAQIIAALIVNCLRPKAEKRPSADTVVSVLQRVESQ